MSSSLDKDPRGLCQETTDVELGEIPLYSVRGRSAQTSRLEQKTGGG